MCVGFVCPWSFCFFSEVLVSQNDDLSLIIWDKNLIVFLKRVGKYFIKIGPIEGVKVRSLNAEIKFRIKLGCAGI